MRADADAYSAIDEKALCTPWNPPRNFSIYPPRYSRLYDGSPVDDPCLPAVAPHLYAYDVPELVERPRVISSDSSDDESLSLEQQASDEQPLVGAIPPASWNDIPVNCRRRMFEFASLRREALLTFEQFNQDVLLLESETIPRLTLPDIIDLALLNGREYQTQKESLFRVALQLSLERFDYQLKPTASGNGTDLFWSHNRNGGETVNNLAIPTNVAVEKMLITGGDVLASFANNILLTFNGPDGFAADVSSDLLLAFSQPLLQRDITLENLTQAERNVVYAARDFARFRREFFADFADQYYNLIRSFRQIEIDSQNYFSLVRAFNQAQAEFRAGQLPRFQVDQVEQDLLSGRGVLIGTCNSLEQSLDSLKINMGLPTETHINIDLTELNSLTQSDQLAVFGNLIDRVRRRLSSELSIPTPERAELLSAAVVLIERMLDAGRVRAELGLPPFDTTDLPIKRARLLADSTRLRVDQLFQLLHDEINSESPSDITIFQRTLDLVNAQLDLASRQVDVAELATQDVQPFTELRPRADAARRQAESLTAEFQQLLDSLETEPQRIEELPEFRGGAESLLRQVEQLIGRFDQLLGIPREALTPAAALQNTIEIVGQLMDDSSAIIGEIGVGLPPIDIGVDNAMITALVLRFDLMNERGMLADDWRQIKFAGDDLRSILNLDASQQIRTRAGVNRPFDFTWDESRTTLSLTFDAPLNRRAQRNNFRFSLIDYQAGIRSLTQLEDDIKFAVRNDLRNLELDREQYVIAVASAALAFERVVSTSLQFRLGIEGISARDFLEAQTDYTDALSAVASRHISYIVDRTQLFLDMELLIVNEQGFWDELYDEQYQPEPFFQLPPWAMPVYGCLPPVCHSKAIRRQLCVPPGVSQIDKKDNTLGDVQDFESNQPLIKSKPNSTEN